MSTGHSPVDTFHSFSSTYHTDDDIYTVSPYGIYVLDDLVRLTGGQVMPARHSYERQQRKWKGRFRNWKAGEEWKIKSSRDSLLYRFNH